MDPDAAVERAHDSAVQFMLAPEPSYVTTDQVVQLLVIAGVLTLFIVAGYRLLRSIRSDVSRPDAVADRDSTPEDQPARTVSGADSVVRNLHELSDLLSRGVLTQTEFQHLKERVLMEPPNPIDVRAAESSGKYGSMQDTAAIAHCPDCGTEWELDHEEAVLPSFRCEQCGRSIGSRSFVPSR